MKALPSRSTIIRVEFMKWQDISSILSSEHLVPKSRLSANATPFIPKKTLHTKVTETKDVHQASSITSGPSDVLSTEYSLVRNEANGNEEDEEDKEDKEDEEDEEDEQEGEGEGEANNILNGEDAEVVSEEALAEPIAVRYSEVELAAANDIWAWYSAVLQRRSARPSISHRRKAMNFELAQLYALNLKLSSEKTWRLRLHKLMFLGPLPHILMCLDKVQDKLQADKKRATDAIKDILEESHMEYDEVMRRMTQTRYHIAHYKAWSLYTDRFTDNGGNNSTASKSSSVRRPVFIRPGISKNFDASFAMLKVL